MVFMQWVPGCPSRRSIYSALIIVCSLFLLSTWNNSDLTLHGFSSLYLTFTKASSNSSEAYTSAPDETENFFNDSLESEDFTDEPPNPGLSPSYHLWSQNPDSVKWSKAHEMCDSLLLLNSNLTEAEEKAYLVHARKWNVPFPHTDDSVAEFLSNCTDFRLKVPFFTKPASRTESKFPIAYVILGARNAAQTVRLFRMIYQPQNAYCLAYDNKSDPGYQASIRRLVGCFPEGNVFLHPRPEPVKWMLYSILHTVMICVKVLLENHKTVPWRYVQIFSWNDFPLKNNAEMVKMFKIFNGSQDSALDPLMPEYYAWNFDQNYKAVPPPKNILPDGLTMYKGSFATTMSKEFVEFLFKNPTSIKFFEWLNNTKCPEEHYWATLIHNLPLNAPGAFPGECLHFYAQHGKTKPFMSRYQIWPFDWWHKSVCNGQWMKTSCVFGVGDMETLITRPELVAHKLYEEFEPAATFCLEQWFWKKGRGITEEFDSWFYETLPSVRYQRTVDKNEFVC